MSKIISVQGRVKRGSDLPETIARWVRRVKHTLPSRDQPYFGNEKTLFEYKASAD